ncbi:hypothetical protein [Variovorax sp. N23]|uniref:hypothetical protein n=1 Tax=Variovorax sp. N23 TaxID=2980555 RepID=UPI0021C5E291|nr:hypothetical protein [Variovorax sp. N23]MCU4119340.1 hypothetical protein [Variovorax sp. N23]
MTSSRMLAKSSKARQFAGVLLLLFSAASACAAPPPKVDERALRDAMSAGLKDSDSAKFKDFKMKASGDQGSLWLICGQVNAKNAFGGYVGFAPFFVMGISANGKTMSTYLGVTVGKVAEMRCAQEGLG